MLKVSGAIMAALLLAAGVAAIGETTWLPTVAAHSEPMPTRGMTMEYVEANYGKPDRRRNAVGDPPITRWEYDGFVVYFEYKRVIHAVAKRRHST